MNENIPQEIQKKGISLQKFGTNDIGWTYLNALEVIDYLKNNYHTILGGDVYKKNGNGYTLTYDNWYINESDFDKSIQISKNYIDHYHEQNGEEFIYTIIYK
ncbi:MULTISPECIES: Imm40 family immunity protein [Vagococcus]|uniref:Imm40 family immunity protein n=1 Tax=Vagococcus TaxID=2737 RepID=UPI000E47BDBE|nr:MULTISPECIES: Imm40 family immunity protein [Vagococcus]RHH66514.1 aminotransferase [Vagococcus sp. AM17-17]